MVPLMLSMDPYLLVPLALAFGACARARAFPMVCVVLAALVVAFALPAPDLGLPFPATETLLTSARAASMVANPRVAPQEEEGGHQRQRDAAAGVRRRDAPRLQSSAQRASMRARLARDFGLVASE